MKIIKFLITQRDTRRIVLTLAAALFLIACGSSDRSTSESKGLGWDRFNVALKRLDGDTVNLQAYRGQILVVDIWATWCKPCIREIPAFNTLDEKYGEDVKVIGIAMDSSPTSIADAIENHDIQYSIFLGDHKIHSVFAGIVAYPTTFVVASDGQISGKFVGIGKKKMQEIEAILDSLLASSAKVRLRKSGAG